MFKVAITGGRDYNNKAKIKEVLGTLEPRPDVLIHGGATGADTLANNVALSLGMTVIIYPANWKKYDKAAGPIRNQQMIDSKPDLLIAFPGGRGTADMIERAELADIPVLKIED